LYNPFPKEEEITEYKPAGDKNEYWHINVFENPALLNFWFDFLDTDESELGYFSVKSVGDRVKAINDKTVTSIYYKEVPNLIFTTY